MDRDLLLNGMDKNTLLEWLDKATALELNEVVKAIEEKFGVSAAAVAVSGGGAAADRAPAERPGEDGRGGRGAIRRGIRRRATRGTFAGSEKCRWQARRLSSAPATAPSRSIPDASPRR